MKIDDVVKEITERSTKLMLLYDLMALCYVDDNYSLAERQKLRKLAAEMYQNGFNMKNVIIQSISAIIIEIIIRIYFSIQSVRDYKNEVDIQEDYSNYNEIKRVGKSHNKEKLNEMLLVAHAIVTVINVGKVVIKRAPWEINIAEIISVIKYGVRVVKATRRRNSEYAKLIRNSKEIHELWGKLEETVNNIDEKAVLETMEVLTI